jgi:hypothetical protein
MSLNDFDTVPDILASETEEQKEMGQIDISEFVKKKQDYLDSLDALNDSAAQIGFELAEASMRARVLAIIDAFAEKLEPSETAAIKTLAIMKELVLESLSAEEEDYDENEEEQA